MFQKIPLQKQRCLKKQLEKIEIGSILTTMNFLVNKETNVRRLSDAIKGNSKDLVIISTGHLANSQKLKAIASATPQLSTPDNFLTFKSFDETVIGRKDQQPIPVKKTILSFSTLPEKPKKYYRVPALLSPEKETNFLASLTKPEVIVMVALGSRAVSLAEELLIKSNRSAHVVFIDVYGSKDNKELKALEFITWLQ